MRRALFRLLSSFRSSRAERELSREIRSHLRLIEDQYIAKGMNAEEARYAALRDLLPPTIRELVPPPEHLSRSNGARPEEQRMHRPVVDRMVWQVERNDERCHRRLIVGGR